jgi:hypothetical protein
MSLRDSGNKFKTGVVAYSIDKEQVNQVEWNNNNVILESQLHHHRGKPWWKFKGNCKLCGKQGHKQGNCPTLK